MSWASRSDELPSVVNRHDARTTRSQTSVGTAARAASTPPEVEPCAHAPADSILDGLADASPAGITDAIFGSFVFV